MANSRITNDIEPPRRREFAVRGELLREPGILAPRLLPAGEFLLPRLKDSDKLQ